MKKNSTGFTLVEMLIVIAILGVLASIGVGVIHHAMRLSAGQVQEFQDSFGTPPPTGTNVTAAIRTVVLGKIISAESNLDNARSEEASLETQVKNHSRANVADVDDILLTNAKIEKKKQEIEDLQGKCTALLRLAYRGGLRDEAEVFGYNPLEIADAGEKIHGPSPYGSGLGFLLQSRTEVVMSGQI